MRLVFFLEKRSGNITGWGVTVVEAQCETVLGGLAGKEIKVSCLQEDRFERLVFFFDIFRMKG